MPWKRVHKEPSCDTEWIENAENLASDINAIILMASTIAGHKSAYQESLCQPNIILDFNNTKLKEAISQYQKDTQTVQKLILTFKQTEYAYDRYQRAIYIDDIKELYNASLNKVRNSRIPVLEEACSGKSSPTDDVRPKRVQFTESPDIKHYNLEEQLVETSEEPKIHTFEDSRDKKKPRCS